SGAIITSGTVADARLSANVPLLNAANTFTTGQTVSSTRPKLVLTETDAPANGKTWDMAADAQQLVIESLDDGGNTIAAAIPITRNGDLTLGHALTVPQGIQAANLGTTPLNASNLSSGTVPDARLSANVALL